MDSAGNVCPGDAEGGLGMATNKATPKTSGGEKRAPEKISLKKAKPGEPVSSGPAAVAQAETGLKAGKKSPRKKAAPFNEETAQVLRDADAGKNLLHYPSLEAMFEDLGI
jgi:hypothetical protein